MNLKNGGTTDFDYNSVLGTSGTYIRFSMGLGEVEMEREYENF